MLDCIFQWQQMTHVRATHALAGDLLRPEAPRNASPRENEQQHLVFTLFTVIDGDCVYLIVFTEWRIQKLIEPKG